MLHVRIRAGGRREGGSYRDRRPSRSNVGTAPKLHEFQRAERFYVSFAVICLREIC